MWENSNDNLFVADDNQEKHTLVKELTIYHAHERDCGQNMSTQRHEEAAGEEGNGEKG
jgi:hypothetical protein